MALREWLDWVVSGAEAALKVTPDAHDVTQTGGPSPNPFFNVTHTVARRIANAKTIK